MGAQKKFTDICDAILQFLPILCIIKRITKNCYMGKRQKKAPDWFGLDEDRFTEAMAKVIQRHRAAIGMSEISDAIIVIVSEETGGISIAQGGELRRNIEPARLHQTLQRDLVRNEGRRAKRQADEARKHGLRRLWNNTFHSKQE